MTGDRKKKLTDGLKEDSIVEKLVPDPSDTPDLIVLSGWAGRSPQEGYWRLYTTPELNEHFEFRDEDLRHHLRIGGHESPLQGTVVWLDSSAKVSRTHATFAGAQKEFLSGGIAQAFLPRIGVGGLTTTGGVVNTLRCEKITAGTCTFVVCTKVEDCLISRVANPCV